MNEAIQKRTLQNLGSVVGTQAIQIAQLEAIVVELEEQLKDKEEDKDGTESE